MEEQFKFMHQLSGIHLVIKSISKDGAIAILTKIVTQPNHWTYYK